MKKPFQFARFALILALPLLLVGCGGSSGTTQTKTPDVARIVQQTRTKFAVPAVGAAFITSDGFSAHVSGIRKAGSSNAVSQDDRFHLASASKSLLGAAVARLVLKGDIGWDFTVSEAFPEFAERISPELKGVTLEQLLAHRSGLSALEAEEEIAALPAFPGSLLQKRRAFARFFLLKAPEFPVGSFNYSNAGYGIAAAMLEAKTGKSYETLIQTDVLTPLGAMGTFGWPAQSGAAQPWGHTESETSPVVFTPADPNAPSTGNDVIGASGDLSLSMSDWARFVQVNLRGLRGQNTVFPAATIVKLHTPLGGSESTYALGWYVANVNGTRTSYHAGTVGTFWTFVAIQPAKNRAVVTACNAGGENGARAALETLEDMLGEKVQPEILG